MKREKKPDAPVRTAIESAQTKQDCCIIFKKGDEIDMNTPKIIVRESRDD
jgi:hypothetical protein